MSSERRLSGAGVVLLAAVSLLLGGCSSRRGEQTMPITTSSTEARQLYLAGRSAVERLRTNDAQRLFAQALQEDSEFALAHLAYGATAGSPRQFFESLRKAVSLCYKVSDGERWLILGAEAGVRNQPATRREYLAKIIERYPRDPRAQGYLGEYHFGQQEFELAIESYQRAIELDPSYSPAYNILGYSYRSLEDYDAAERAFQKYIELIPDEPNPYDSYAELLLKMGRFAESIRTYRRALEIAPTFMPSYIGIANVQLAQGEPEAARATLGELQAVVDSDRERRAVHLWTAASYVHERRYQEAAAEIAANQTLARAAGETVSLAADINLIGVILREAGRYDEALARLLEAVDTAERADVPLEVKEATQRNFFFEAARLEILRGNLEAAERHARDYRERAYARQIPAEIRRSHLLAGMMAIARREFDAALTALRAADQRDVVTLYALGLAHRGQGDTDTARRDLERAAHFNEISVSYAFVRPLALAALASL